MNIRRLLGWCGGLLALASVGWAADASAPLLVVQVHAGALQGVVERNGVTAFKGVPYAQPPVGDLRWREPQPAKAWSGVRAADHFGPHPEQRVMWQDMIFRSEMSEDCLYLNVWTPATRTDERLPVLVYIHGGGFVAGSGDEPRYDGATLASHGIIVVTINYRLGVFGFFSLPELAQESPHHTTGNYAFLDQLAALRWVHDNIAAFGGDPAKVTIGGQSAGAASVNAQMVSPLARGLFRAAIAESGSLLPSGARGGPTPVAEGERIGQRLMAAAGAKTLAELRAVPAAKLLELQARPEFSSAATVIDGYFLTESPKETLTTGRQADVPLIAGSTNAEVDFRSALHLKAVTRDAYAEAVRQLYGADADQILALYPAKTDADVVPAASALAADRFAGFRTWKLADLHSKTSGSPVYRYLWTQTPPRPPWEANSAEPPRWGAPHSSELPYLFGNLPLLQGYAWTQDDLSASAALQQYVTNFVKTENPNGSALAHWPWYQASIPHVMVLEAVPRTIPEPDLKRHELLDTLQAHGN